MNKNVQSDNKSYQDKYTALRSRWQGVKGRQVTEFKDRLYTADKYYNKSLSDIKERLRLRSQTDSQRSVSHQSSIHSAQKRRSSVVQQQETKEVKRVVGALQDHVTRQSIHYVRADSARSERVSSMKRQN